LSPNSFFMFVGVCIGRQVLEVRHDDHRWPNGSLTCANRSPQNMSTGAMTD